MRQNDPGAAVPYSIRQNGPDRHVDPMLVAIMMADMQALRLLIDMRHPQPFPACCTTVEAIGEEGAGGALAIELHGQ